MLVNAGYKVKSNYNCWFLHESLVTYFQHMNEADERVGVDGKEKGEVGKGGGEWKREGEWG